MAKNQSTAAAPVPSVTKARVLMDGAFGKADDVVELGGEELTQALASGQVDADPAAVAYAESLQ